jgi:hypothetical protein
MTDEQINIAIAELCGWKHRDGGMWVMPAGDTVGEELIPDFCDDLNAMSKAENRLDVNSLSEYADHLDKVCVPTHICPLTHWQGVVMSTARQRSEAFLRTFGKWVE